MPTVADILNARRRQSIFDRVSSGSSTTAPAPEPPSIFDRLSQATSEPLPMEGRLSLLPAMVTPERGREWAVPGVLAGAWNAFTAPGRALQGQELGPDEALNVAGTAMLGGMPVPKPGAGGVGLNVFHGSPHKFDKFDMSKIGTGEGTQVFGHGLYFAERPEVAKSYATDKSYVGRAMAGAPASEWNATRIAQDAVNVHGPDAAKHLESVLRSRAGSKHPAQAEENKKVADALEMIRGGKVERNTSLYKVDLPDEQIAKMLDWDKPLGQQPKHIQDAVIPLLHDAIEARPYGGGWGALEPDAQTLRELFTKTGTPLGLYPAADAASFNVPGSVVVKALGKGDKESPDVAKALKGVGIPGVRYLDRASRAGGEGTRNFVVFDDQIPKILSRE